ncbi:MAG: sulfite exporter TauE/SafE family protein, partial [Chloroflexota bacterium]|nr:sulfite exporter TauE/SafE family protein [Chloroflexota bacterium]
AIGGDLVLPDTDDHPERGRGAAILASLSGDDYDVRHLGRGMAGAAGAGVASALMGIGGGIIKVPLMHVAMGVPLRVATATSNLMIGITAASSAVIYLLRGEIDPYVAGPTAIGVFLGATLGSRLAHRIDVRILRLLFVVVLAYTSIQMLLRTFA